MAPNIVLFYFATKKPAATKRPAAAGSLIAGAAMQDIFVVTNRGGIGKSPEAAYKKASVTKKVVNIPPHIQADGVTYKVTGIASGALKGNKNVIRVTIPDTVVKIGTNAFRNCKNLSKMTIQSRRGSF